MTSVATTLSYTAVAEGVSQQFALGIRKPALGREAAKPVREFVVMPPGIG
jgi:hypothetical protein